MTHSELWREMESPQHMACASPDAPVLLAYSGGADSTALLYCLLEQRRRQPFPLILAHVNHGIRGEEALRDRNFCVGIAQCEGLEICVLDADVPSLAAKSGRGLEEEARALRYEYFERLMREREIPILVTAHHANDQLETLLFRMSRGTGLHGLCGIPAVRRFANGYLVRPMLGFSRERIEAFCRDRNLDYVTDATNQDRIYARNRLRGEVVPILEELFSGCAERVAVMTEALREDDGYLFSLADAFLEKHSHEEGLPIAELRTLAVPIWKRVLMRWAEEWGSTLEGVHLEELMRVSLTEDANARVALPNGRYAVLQNGNLQLTEERMRSIPDYHVPFAVGVLAAGDTGIQISVRKADAVKDGEKIHNFSTPFHNNLTVKLDTITKDAYWRPRKAGDVLLLRGMHRKLRRLYAEAGFSVDARERMPLLCDGDGVLWAPGIGLRDGVASCADTGGYDLQICFPKEL